jgi:hypothetical protein
MGAIAYKYWKDEEPKRLETLAQIERQEQELAAKKKALQGK